ncbi:S1C family serine protease [Micromonospora sp. CPCC 206061]|uniref:S1C family serine protease n=1 Tax=Micromonospora sp. CPCC 206061 TaxID=3122410 RepID=UPI002FF0DE90
MRTRSSLAALATSAALATAALTACTDDERSAADLSPTPASDLASGFSEVVARVEPSVVTVLVGGGLGSGVVFRDGGLVLTNEHVVQGARTVQLALASGERIAATVVSTDPVTDLAVLRAERTDLPPASFRTELPATGEIVLAMGTPLGFRNSVTMGVVSGVGREIPGSAGQSQALVDLIQTDAAISPGNSGGALVDTAGRVVGINDAYLPPQSGAVSIGFAIPAATAQDVAEDLLDDGKATHPFVGIQPGRLTPQIADRLGAPTDRGVLVLDVVDDGPAAAAGLHAGDIITTFHGEQTATVEQFLGALRAVEPGQVVDVTYLRGGDTATAKVTLGQIER